MQNIEMAWHDHRGHVPKDTQDPEKKENPQQ